VHLEDPDYSEELNSGHTYICHGSFQYTDYLNMLLFFSADHFYFSANLNDVISIWPKRHKLEYTSQKTIANLSIILHV
jgi:hypothetical protein